LDTAALREVGIAGQPGTRAVKLARLARQAGLDGVVCSAQNAGRIRRACGKSFLIVVPGVRPAGWGGAKGDDQKRVATPAKAIRAGADYIVVGRPITSARDPHAAAKRIVEEIARAQQSLI